MKEIVKQENVNKTVYQAIDGTEFINKEECRKYEDTALACINARYRKLVVHTSDEYTLFEAGSEDNIVEVVNLQSSKDVDIVFQMWLYYNSYHSKNTDICDERLNKLTICSENSHLLFVYRGYEGDCFGILKSFDEYMEMFNDLKNKINE
jgi:hypothetical protein